MNGVKRPLTMKDIAKMAGVSTATVSRILNHNGRYSKETESRVKKLIEENNYVIDQTAKGLRKKYLETVGIIVPDITNPHFAKLVLNIQTSLFQRGYSSIIGNTNENLSLEEEHVHSLKAQHVCGFIMISTKRYHQSPRRFPTLYLDRPARGGEKEDITIESDNFKGGYLAGKQLGIASCKRLAIIRTNSNDCNQDTRKEGFLKALSEVGIPEEKVDVLDSGDALIQSAYSRIREEMRNGFLYDGLFCTTDTLATGVYTALREGNIKVPEEVKIVGFDDCDLAFTTGPGLTSVHQDVGKMAELAVDALVRRLTGEPLSSTHFYLPVYLSVRASTD